MAAFKLQEAARRLRGLARQATAPETRQRFEVLSRELNDREAQLWALVEADSSGDDVPAPNGGRDSE